MMIILESFVITKWFTKKIYEVIVAANNVLTKHETLVLLYASSTTTST